MAYGTWYNVPGKYCRYLDALCNQTSVIAYRSLPKPAEMSFSCNVSVCEPQQVLLMKAPSAFAGMASYFRKPCKRNPAQGCRGLGSHPELGGMGGGVGQALKIR
jgi:hypothetical protein